MLVTQFRYTNIFFMICELVSASSVGGSNPHKVVKIIITNGDISKTILHSFDSLNKYSGKIFFVVHYCIT